MEVQILFSHFVTTKITGKLPAVFALRDSPSSAKYDFHYCLHNGWLSDEVRALQNDFDGMKKKAEEFCTLVFFSSKVCWRLERR